MLLNIKPLIIYSFLASYFLLQSSQSSNSVTSVSSLQSLHLSLVSSYFYNQANTLNTLSTPPTIKMKCDKAMQCLIGGWGFINATIS